MSNELDARPMADAYAELNRRGWSVRKIANGCGIAHPTVVRYLKCVSGSLGNQRPTFWEAYSEARTDKTTAERIVASTENENVHNCEQKQAKNGVSVSAEGTPKGGLPAPSTHRAVCTFMHHFQAGGGPIGGELMRGSQLTAIVAW